MWKRLSYFLDGSIWGEHRLGGWIYSVEYVLMNMWRSLPVPSLKLSRTDPAISQFCPLFIFFLIFDKTVHIPLFSSSSIHICTAAYGVTLCSDCTQQELRVREGFWAKYCFCADAGMTGLFRLSPMYQFPSAAVKLVNPLTDLPAATKARVTSHHTQVSLLARNGIFFI